MRRNKFLREEHVNSLDALSVHLSNGGWVYWKGRPKHPRFIEKVPFDILARAVRTHALCYARRVLP